MREGDGNGGPAKVRRPAWVNPYEGKSEILMRVSLSPRSFQGGHLIRRYCLIMDQHRTLLDVCTTTL
ncbi:hypothetical protein TSUD_216350 [Trifolium subterraneum]|uniref:Uncharacterized protein n=1 Tax=Trifolium subterraneum TaxID=3900 RepID=A0A2Z6M1N6_TRISU|nr:hypothetical protein TSUD_216350 [Trifolium subterraneum]